MFAGPFHMSRSKASTSLQYRQNWGPAGAQTVHFLSPSSFWGLPTQSHWASSKMEMS